MTMPDSGLKLSNPELQKEYETELEKELARVREYHLTLPISQRTIGGHDYKPTYDIYYLETTARRRVESRYQQLESIDQLRQSIQSGEFVGMPSDVATDYLTWIEAESRLIREQASIEQDIDNSQRIMAQVGKPSIWSKVSTFFYEHLGIPGKSDEAVYNEAMALYENSRIRLGEIAQETTNAKTYQSLYEGLGMYIRSGKVTSYDDLFSLTDSNGNDITRFSEIGRDDPILQSIFEQVASTVVDLPADSDDKLSYTDMIAELARKPEGEAPTGISALTVDALVRSLQSVEPTLPSGYRSIDEVLQGYSEAGIPDEVVDELNSLTSYVDELEAYWQALSDNQESVRAGISEAQLPELGFGSLLLQTISQPALTVLDGFRKFYQEWTAPWGGMLYRMKYTYTRLPGAGLTEHEKEFQRLYEEAKLTEDWWHAGATALENAELGFLDRAVFEWVVDPVSWLGMGLGKGVMAASKSNKLVRGIGATINKFDEGWLKAWDVFIFDRIKNAGQLIQKIPTQAAVSYAGKDMTSVANYLIKSTNASYYTKIPLSKAKDALKNAVNWKIHHPEDAGDMARAGEALLRRNALDEGAVKELGKKLGSNIEITREVVLDVNSITNGMITEAATQILTKKSMPAFLLRTFGVAESKKSLRLASTEVNKLLSAGKTEALAFMNNTVDVPDLLTKLFNRNHSVYLSTVQAASARNLSMAGRTASFMSNVNWKVMNVWRNTFDRWVVTPGARMYLAFSAYGPGNILEGVIKQTMAGQTPYNPLRILRGNKPVTVVNPTARGQRLMAGLSKPLELEAAIPRIEMAGESPTLRMVENLSPEGQVVLNKWRAALSGGPIGRFFIDLPGKYGMYQRWDYYRKMFTGFLGDEEATAIMSSLAKNIDNAVKTMPDNLLQSLNITKSEFKSQLLDRSIMNPTAVRDVLDDMIADRLMLADDVLKREARKKGKKIGEEAVSADRALADRISGGKVAEITGKYPLVPQVFSDDLIQSASDGSLYKNAGKAIDEKVEGYTAAMYDYFVHTPEFYAPRYTEYVNITMNKPVTNIDEFNEVLSDLQHLRSFYSESTDDVIRAMNELETKMSKQMQVNKWNEWRGQYTASVYDDMGKYADTADEGFESIIARLRENIGAVSPNEQVAINNLITAWSDEQRYLKSFWKKRRADEVAEIAEIKKLHGEAKSQAWAKFRDNQNAAHALRRERQAPLRDAVIKQEFYSSEALGTLSSYPAYVDARGRKLAKMDVATLFHSHPQQMGQAMLRLETMTLKPRAQFIGEVRAQADIMATRAGKTNAAEMGFSDEAIGSVYDEVLRDMYMSPEAASVLEPHLMELKALKDELWSVYNTKGIPKGTSDEFQTWLDDLADTLDEVPGYTAPAPKVKKPVTIPDYDIGLGQRVASKKDLGIFEGEVNKLVDKGIAREDAIAQVLGLEKGSNALILDKDIVNSIRDRLTKAADDVVVKTDEGQIKLSEEMNNWFMHPRNESLQTIGKVASETPEYLAKVRAILKEQYPSGYIRVYRGTGKASGAALKREYTNVTSSRKAALDFQDTWEGIEAVAPDIDNILIKIEDVVSIGAVEESELIIRSDVLTKYMNKPITLPAEPVKALKQLSPEFQSAKQRAADKASKEYYKDWADYTNENASTALMRTIYPFWTYELHRLFWLPRASVRTPGLFKAWGTYMDNTDNGYVHIPGTSMEINPLRGTIFMGGMVRLMRKDYPEYYDRFPGVSEYFDFYSRYGFYPATYINFLKMFGGKTIQGKANFGEILPAWVKTPLNAYISVAPESTAAKTLLDTVLPEPFRDYTTVLLANAICQRERKSFNGMDILDKMNENLELTPEEQEVWTKAVQGQGWMGALMEQAGVIRIRTEEQNAAWEASGKLIQEMTGYTLEDQLWIRQHGFRVGDYTQLDPLQQSLLGEMDAMKYHSGIFSTLMPTSWQDEDKRRREFFREVTNYSEARRADQEELDRKVRAGELTMRQWDSERSRLAEANSNFFTNLSETDRYRDIAIEMEDVTRPDGTIREGMITRAEKRNELPPIDHPAQEILNTYYSIELGQVVDPASGNLVTDWDGYFQRIDTIINALDKGNRAELVEMITKNMSDLVKLRWEISRKYFRGYNRKSTAILLTQFTDEEQTIIKQWMYGTPTERDIAREAVVNGIKVVSAFQEMNRVTGQNLRALSPELDAWLQFFGKTDSVLTPAAEELYRQYARDWNIPE